MMRRKSPEEIAATILFGDKLQPVNLAELSKATGISHSTLSDYKRQPGKIPLYRLSIIAKVRKLDGEQIGEMLWAYRGGKGNAGNETRKL